VFRDIIIAERRRDVLEEREIVYWHEAGFEAFQLELHEYKDFLHFEDEYQLSKEALRIDILIIKKERGVRIEKNIGRIFRDYNIIEYKPEGYSLSARDYNKVVGYAFLYASFTPVSVSDITVTFSIMSHPRELLKYLRDERGFSVNEKAKGIYYVEGDTFSVQILEGKMLSEDENIFLRNLRSNLNTKEATNTIEAYKNLGYNERKNAFIDRLVQANRNTFQEVIMVSEAVKELILTTEVGQRWLRDREVEYAKEIAKEIARKALRRGRPIEEIVEDFGLPYETVINL